MRALTTISLALAAGLGLALAGCGEKKEESSAPAAPSFDAAGFSSSCATKLQAGGYAGAICECLAGKIAALPDAKGEGDKALEVLGMPLGEVSAALSEAVRPLGTECYNQAISGTAPAPAAGGGG